MDLNELKTERDFLSNRERLLINERNRHENNTKIDNLEANIQISKDKIEKLRQSNTNLFTFIKNYQRVSLSEMAQVVFVCALASTLRLTNKLF